MNKKLKQVTTVATASLVVASSINPAVYVQAEENNKGVEASEESTQTGSTETVHNDSKENINVDSGSTQKSESSNLEVQTPGENVPVNPESPKEETTSPEEYVYTLADVDVRISTSGYSEIVENTLNIVKGLSSGLSVQGNLRKSSIVSQTADQADSQGEVSIDKISISCGDVVKVFSSEGMLDLVELEGFNLSTSNIVLSLSNGQSIGIPMSMLNSGLAKVTDVIIRDCNIKDFAYAYNVNGDYVRSGSTMYYKDSTPILVGSTSILLPSLSLEEYGVSYINSNNIEERCGIDDLLGRDLTDCSQFKMYFRVSNGNEVFSKEYSSLSELFTIPELQGISRVVKDTIAPSVELCKDTTERKEYKGVSYVVRDGNLVFSISENTSMITKINKVINKETLAQIPYTIDEDGNLCINTAQFESGSEVMILIEVSDEVGNIGSLEYKVDCQKVAPTIKGLGHSAVVTKGGKSYSKQDLQLVFSGYDNPKIASIDLYKDGEVVGNTLEGTINITDSGEYLIKVTDIVGNCTVYKLSDLYSDLGNYILKDTNLPTVAVTVNNEEPKDSWVVNNAILGVNFADDIELKCARITINGMMFNYNFEGLSEKKVEINLKEEVIKPKNGLYKVSISYEDYAGNAGEEYSTVIKADFDKPTFKLSKVKGSFVEKDGYIYTPELELSGTVSDIGSSAVKTELLLDGVLLKEVNKLDKIPISSEGEYSLRVTDASGLCSEYSLAELIGSKSSNVRIDSDTPVIKAVSGFKPDKLKGKENWYKACPILTYNISDTYMESVSIKVNGKEFVNGLSTDNVYIVDTKKYTGDVTVEVVAKDKYGHISKETYSYIVDSSIPSITTATLDTDFKVRGGVAFFKKVPTLEVIARDSGIGVGSYILSGSKEESNKQGKFRLGSGTFYIEVLDELGNSTGVKHVKELVKEIPKDVDRFIVDSTSPEITASLPKDSLEGSWYNHDVVFKAKLKDGIGIERAYVYVNNVLTETYVSDSIDVKSAEIEVNSSKVSPKENGLYDVRVEVVDNAGNSTFWSSSFNVDKSAPDITSATLSESYRVRGGVAFFQSTPMLSIVANDGDGIGISEYILSGSKQANNTSGVFELGTGKFSIEVKDRLGNSIGARSLSKVVPGLSTDNFIVDTVSPDIGLTLPKGGVNRWYSDDVSFKASISDDIGIKEASVYINGILTNTYVSPNIGVTSAQIDIDTSKAKADDNGMYTIVVNVIDNAGNQSSSKEYLYIDRSAPTIEKFTFTGNGYQEGVSIDGSDKYGFYFSGNATCTIDVSDGSITSGLGKIYVDILPEFGVAEVKEYTLSNNQVTFSLPENFKGTISAYAEDKVGNKGKVKQPDGVITENGNCFINNLKLAINLPTTQFSDNQGLPLYANDVVATAEVGCTFSGLRKLEWGIDKEILGTVSIDNSGSISGDVSEVKQIGKNLVLNLLKNLQLSGNSNGLKVWVRVTDRTGQTSETDKLFSIDKDVPTIDVSYDSSELDGYYNKTRTATITVHERNFDASKFVVLGSAGVLGGWSNNGDTWVNTMVFSEDGEYSYSLDYTDRAGNVAKTYSSEKFYIDKTAPQMSVSWDNNSSSNGNYYNKARTATITVVDKYFDGSRFRLEGNGSLSGWSSNGDSHTASVAFSEDGECDFSIVGEDLASNPANGFSSGKFIIDKTVPAVSIEGIQENVSYKQDCSLRVKVSDAYLDSVSSISLTGKRNGVLRLTGAFGDRDGEFIFSDFPKEEVYDDIYTLSINVLDKAGNAYVKDTVFSVNRFGSSYSFANSDMLGKYLNNAEDIVIIESNVDKLDIEKARVSVILDGKEKLVDSKYISISEANGDNGKYSYTYKVDKSAFDTDGKYLVQVFSHAVEGSDYSSISEEYAFVLDTTLPEVIISGIDSDSKYHEYSKKVSIDVRDLSGIQEITASLNGKELVMSKANGIYSFDIQENSTSQELEVIVVDLAGNKTIKKVENFIITSNMWVFIVNQLWFKLGIGAVVAFLSMIIGLIIKNRKSTRREENSMLREQAELYHESSTSSSSSAINASERDLAEDLDNSDNTTK